MVVRICILLIVSLTIIFRIEPTLAFSSRRCKQSSNNQQQRRAKILGPLSFGRQQLSDSSGVLARCLQSFVIAATSLQILSAGQAIAFNPTAGQLEPRDVMLILTATSPEIPSLTLKYPELPKLDLGRELLDIKGEKFLSNLPRFPITIPEGSKLLTTTVRPDIETVQRKFEEIKKIQWWKNTGFDLEKANDAATANAQNLLGELSHIVDRMRSLSFNWQIISGLLGIFVIADVLQNSRQLSKIVEEQNIQISDQVAKIDSSNSMNAEIVTVLKIESLKLIDEVDSLIRQLDDKSLHIDSLNDTLQTLSLNVNSSEVASKQVLTKYSYQLQSQAALINSLKSQIVEIPRKIAREVGNDYKAQILTSEKKNEELSRDIAQLKMEKMGSSSTTSTSTTATIEASTPSTFPPISDSFPTSIFTPVGAVAAASERGNALLLENKQIKMKIEVLERENETEKSRNSDLERRISDLQTQLKEAAEQMLGAEDKVNARHEEYNSRLLKMETMINASIDENEKLRTRLLAAESEASRLAALEATRVAAEKSSPLITQSARATNDDDDNDKNLLLNALTLENDDLKQRLLNSDERLFDLQQDNLKKLETAKIMTKQLNARLTEIGVQQENKDGKSKSQ